MKSQRKNLFYCISGKPEFHYNRRGSSNIFRRVFPEVLSPDGANRRSLMISLFALSAFRARPSIAGVSSRRDVSSNSWPALPDLDLEVKDGTILDFSRFSDHFPAGRFGWASNTEEGQIRFSESSTRLRLFSASFQFSPASGGFPSKEESERVVDQLIKTGYNAVRMQCIEANLMSGRESDFGYSPEQLDRLHFFLAELKRRGIYVVADVAYIDNGAYGGVYPHRWVKKYNFRRDLYWADEAKSHWKRLVKTMFGVVNPYTGISPIVDPALLGLILSNEGGVIELAFRGGGGWSAKLPEDYKEPFRSWLTERYGSSDVWRLKWGREASADESLDRLVRLPANMRGSTIRHTDFMRFVVDLEQSTYEWMRDYVRGLGFKGLVTSYNNWSWLHSDLSRSKLQCVDMHSYHAHPTGFIEPGSTVPGESSLPDAGAYLRWLTSSRQWGKPFMVTEYGHAFWNSYRREASALVPAYAALQGWDLLTQFSENSLQLSYRLPQPSRRAAIFPFTISTDPIRRSGERLAALLYARGDVSPARGQIEFRISSDEALARNGAWSQLNETASRMALITGVGLGIDAQGNQANRVTLAEADDFLVDKTRLGYQVFAGSGSALRKKLSTAGVMDDRAWGAFDRGRFVSDTGELDLNSAASRFTINTPRTAVLLTHAADDRVGALSITGLSVPALLAASSMDDQPLPKSRRLLLFVLTDATNTGIEFDDAARTRLRKLGTLPARIQPVQVQLQLGLTSSVPFRLYALAQDGRRVQTLPVQVVTGGVRMSIDTATLENGPSTMFELVAE